MLPWFHNKKIMTKLKPDFYRQDMQKTKMTLLKLENLGLLNKSLIAARKILCSKKLTKTKVNSNTGTIKTNNFKV